MLEYMALNKRGGVNFLKEVFESFFRFNEILCINPKQESNWLRTSTIIQQSNRKTIGCLYQLKNQTT